MKRGNFMKKTNILKVLLIVIITLGLVFATTEVFADSMLDLSGTLQGGTGTGLGTEEESGSGTETGTGTGTGTGFGAEQESGTEGDNQSSSYTESDLPNTGVETSVLTIAAFIIFAIIGIYTFMKLSDYSNI